MDKYTIGDILEKEREMFLTAEEKYGEYFANASLFNALLHSFITEVRPAAWIFVMFLSQVRKHHTLALFSTVRLHHVQAMLDLRQTLESGANAAYAIAVPNQDHFAITKSNGTLDAPQRLSTKRYKWLMENYPDGAQPIKDLKNIINRSCAHSNIVYAFNNFEMPKDMKRLFGTPFFDIEDDHLIKTDLWMVANIALGLMDLFYGVNKDHKLVTFSPDFVERLKDLGAQNQKLKGEMMGHPRFKRSAHMRKI